MDPLDKLSDYFKKFPGIGPRQARRFAYFVLGQQKEYFDGLVSSMQTVRAQVTQCPSCLLYFTRDASNRECLYCRDERRDRKVLLIVEKDIDVQTIEKSHAYSGVYFVLGGTVPLHDDTIPTFVRARELITRIKTLIPLGLSEIIFALSANAEGDNTYDQVKKMLAPVIGEHIRMSVLGRGLSTGTEIEYSDVNTITSALNGRK